MATARPCYYSAMQTTASIIRQRNGFSLGGTLVTTALFAAVIAIGAPVVEKELRSGTGRAEDAVRRMESSVAGALESADALGRSVSVDAQGDCATTPVWVLPFRWEDEPPLWMVRWRGRPRPLFGWERPVIPPGFREGGREPPRRRRRRGRGHRPRPPGHWRGSARRRCKERIQRRARPAEYGGQRANHSRPHP
jgi:hypothetical protein